MLLFFGIIIFGLLPALKLGNSMSRKLSFVIVWKGPTVTMIWFMFCRMFAKPGVEKIYKNYSLPEGLNGIFLPGGFLVKLSRSGAIAKFGYYAGKYKPCSTGGLNGVSVMGFRSYVRQVYCRGFITKPISKIYLWKCLSKTITTNSMVSNH